MTTLVSIALIALVVGLYLAKKGKKSRKVKRKIEAAKESGLHEPVHIHPYIDPAKCIGSGACVKACPEHDVIGIVSGKGKLVNGSRCVGHGACAAACPVGAITLVFGTETRGVEIPYVTPVFETNIKGVFIVGELGGMGLIKNAITQGRQAVDHIVQALKTDERAGDALDILIVGAGPAGIGASLAALKHKLKFLTIEQADIGGTVFSYPRRKIVMTSPVELPIHGNVKLKETTKEALLELWSEVIKKTGLRINTGEKMTGLTVLENGFFKATTSKADYAARNIILAIGRRGTPRKLGVPGEDLPKVFYRLLDPEQHKNENILVVGGGDSAVEAAFSLSKQPGNKVTLSYRGNAFARIKPGNAQNLEKAVKENGLKVLLHSNVVKISEKEVEIEEAGKMKKMPNDQVYIFAGGELPNEFLKSVGIRIEKKFGTA